MMKTVFVCFNSSSAPYEEINVINDLLDYFNLKGKVTSEVIYKTDYVLEDIEGLLESLAQGDVTQELLYSATARYLVNLKTHPDFTNRIDEDFIAKSMGDLKIYVFKVKETPGFLLTSGI